MDQKDPGVISRGGEKACLAPLDRGFGESSTAGARMGTEKMVGRTKRVLNFGLGTTRRKLERCGQEEKRTCTTPTYVRVEFGG